MTTRVRTNNKHRTRGSEGEALHALPGRCEVWLENLQSCGRHIAAPQIELPRVRALTRMDPYANGKRAAAIASVNEFCSRDMVVGVGSGSTIVFAVERLAERARKEGLSFTCIPSSFQAKSLIMESGLQLGSLDSHPDIDVAIDGGELLGPPARLIPPTRTQLAQPTKWTRP
jgi:hypothetical protein